MKINPLNNYSSFSTLKDEAVKTTEENEFLRQLEKAVKEKDDKKLYAACQELESVFLSKVLQAMRATIVHSDLIEHSFAMDTFESMLYDEYAEKISQTSATGIADIIYKQLKNK
ncbi:rod-binding protein [Thermosyntropha sp.]|uniref:rod-binding protein n=1 Tax=Thermosyntropha sp. TaxID=2740820 RepID=UPI0025DA7610|nr:rod-binding protein [Thermosyntropha sp.]MBO8158588.1 rod-binding protein [Thermosyntropha sp.]